MRVAFLPHGMQNGNQEPLVALATSDLATAHGGALRGLARHHLLASTLGPAALPALSSSRTSSHATLLLFCKQYTLQTSVERSESLAQC